MRVFLDTNVLFSGLYSPVGAPNRVLEAASGGAFQLVVSANVLGELVRNVRNKAPHLLVDVNEFLNGASIEVVESPPASELEGWHDAGFGSDAPIIAAAVSAEVDYFCTGDRRLLGDAERGKLGRLRVVSPAELIVLLEAAG